MIKLGILVRIAMMMIKRIHLSLMNATLQHFSVFSSSMLRHGLSPNKDFCPFHTPTCIDYRTLLHPCRTLVCILSYILHSILCKVNGKQVRVPHLIPQHNKIRTHFYSRHYHCRTLTFLCSGTCFGSHRSRCTRHDKLCANLPLRLQYNTNRNRCHTFFHLSRTLDCILV